MLTSCVNVGPIKFRILKLLLYCQNLFDQAPFVGMFKWNGNVVDLPCSNYSHQQWRCTLTWKTLIPNATFVSTVSISISNQYFYEGNKIGELRWFPHSRLKTYNHFLLSYSMHELRYTISIKEEPPGKLGCQPKLIVEKSNSLVICWDSGCR